MDTLQDKVVKTRKEHRCWGCGRKFEKGSPLRVLKQVDGGDIFSSYWCKTCDEYWKRFMPTWEEVGFSELRNEDKDGWEKVRFEVEGEPPVSQAHTAP